MKSFRTKRVLIDLFFWTALEAYILTSSVLMFEWVYGILNFIVINLVIQYLTRKPENQV